RPGHPLHGGSRTALRPRGPDRQRPGRGAGYARRPGRAGPGRQDRAFPALGPVRRPAADRPARGDRPRARGPARRRHRDRGARQRGDPRPARGRRDRPRRPARLLEPRGRLRQADRKSAARGRSSGMNSLALARSRMARPRRLPLPGTPHGAAFGRIVRNEARLARRQPFPIIGSIALPVVLMIIFGEIPSSSQVISTLGGLTLFDVYLPIIMVLGLTMLTLLGLPGPLVSYREIGVLRRLSTTPVPPSWLLAAQVVVQLAPPWPAC